MHALVHTVRQSAVRCAGLFWALVSKLIACKEESIWFAVLITANYYTYPLSFVFVKYISLFFVMYVVHESCVFVYVCTYCGPRNKGLCLKTTCSSHEDDDNQRRSHTAAPRFDAFVRVCYVLCWVIINDFKTNLEMHIPYIIYLHMYICIHMCGVRSAYIFVGLRVCLRDDVDDVCCSRHDGKKSTMLTTLRLCTKYAVLWLCVTRVCCSWYWAARQA